MPHGTIIPDVRKPENDKGYFEIITKTVFQAGFSYEVIERKWEGFREIFDNFDPTKVAKWTEAEVAKALESSKIVRNPKKINATVQNAKAFQAISDQNGSFSKYMDSIRDLPYDEKSKAISSNFKWMGKTGAFFFLYCVNEEVPNWEDR